ncbi:MAG: hypothetical protein JXL97_16095 [Bacteroidales bacterium]|nr:hypothetical protein [Bacteroidales bacterium]
MTKKLIISLLLFLPILAFGQNIITGTVCYENGEGIPEVKVWIRETKENTLTNLDGSFSIETVLDSISDYYKWSFYIENGDIENIEREGNYYKIVMRYVKETIPVELYYAHDNSTISGYANCYEKNFNELYFSEPYNVERKELRIKKDLANDTLIFEKDNYRKTVVYTGKQDTLKVYLEKDTTLKKITGTVYGQVYKKNCFRGIKKAENTTVSISETRTITDDKGYFEIYTNPDSFPCILYFHSNKFEFGYKQRKIRSENTNKLQVILKRSIIVQIGLFCSYPDYPDYFSVNLQTDLSNNLYGSGISYVHIWDRNIHGIKLGANYLSDYKGSYTFNFYGIIKKDYDACLQEYGYEFQRFNLQNTSINLARNKIFIGKEIINKYSRKIRKIRSNFRIFGSYNKIYIDNSHIMSIGISSQLRLFFDKRWKFDEPRFDLFITPEVEYYGDFSYQ